MYKQYPAWARLPISTVRMRKWKRLQEATPLIATKCMCATATFSLNSNVATTAYCVPDYWQVQDMNLNCLSLYLLQEVNLRLDQEAVQ